MTAPIIYVIPYDTAPGMGVWTDTPDDSEAWAGAVAYVPKARVEKLDSLCEIAGSVADAQKARAEALAARVTELEARVDEVEMEPIDLTAQAKGRAAFLRDRGAVKTPDLLEALAARVAELESEPVGPSDQREKYDGLRARILVGKASQEEASSAIDKLCHDNERLAVSAGRQRARAEAAEAREARLREALEQIEAWRLPPSGKFYPNADGTDSDRPAPYDSVYGYGSRGGEMAIRAIARAALTGDAT